MKIKKLSLIFVLGLMTILLGAVATAQQSPIINITLMNQDPDPVGPGQYVEIRFKIHNEGFKTVAENFQISLEPTYPFTLDSSENADRSIGDLPALGAGGNVIIVKYKLRVAEDAVEGDNKIYLKYKHGNTDWIREEFEISVQTVDANLGIVSIDTYPEKIKPGEEAQVNITVKNMADSTMNDISFKLDLTYSDLLDSATAITAADSIIAFNALPFAPIGSATEQKIYSLGPGKEATFTYNLIAYSDAESRVYKIPVEISYYDELQTEYVKEDIIGLIVGTKPELSVVIDETDIYVGKQSGTVVLRFINKGFSDVKFLDVMLADNGEYELISSEEVYIGNVDSDDYETAEFEIYLKNGAGRKEGEIKLPIMIEYRDANNNIYTEEHDLELKVVSAKKLGIKSSSGLSTLLLLLIIGGVVYFFYRRRKKKNKK